MNRVKKDLYLLSLVLLAIILFIYQSVQLNKHEIWFSIMDMDSTVIVESLMVNSGIEPNIQTYHPSLGTFILYGKFFKLFDFLNIIPVSEFNQLEASDDPLMLLPDLFYKGRTISIIIAIFCALIFGFIFYILTRKLLFFTISTISLLFSGGLLFQSLILRSELTSVFFVLLSMLLLIMHSKGNKPSFLTVIASGVLFGFAVLTKIQVLPLVLFMIILLLYIVFKKLRKYPEGLLKNRLILFFFIIVILRLYLYFMNLLFHVYSSYGQIPVLSLTLILFILLSSMISTLLWFKQRRISSFLNHVNLFLIGFLISFLIVFYLSHITTDKTMRDIVDLAFQSGAQKSVTNELLHSTSSISEIFGGFVRFFKYYLSESYFLVFLAFFFLLTGFDYKSTVTFVFGVGYLCFNSLRHFGPHYFLYSDIFLYATLMLILILFLTPGSKYSKFRMQPIKLRTRYILTIVMLCLMGLSQLIYMKKAYPAYGAVSRNLIDEIPFSHTKNKKYSEMMIKKYKNAINVIERVYNDPYLNGSKDGIDITEKVNYRIYGWLALPQVRDIKLKVSSQDIVNREMMSLLKNIYQNDKRKFNEIKDRILYKSLEWSDDDIDRRIIREIPSNLLNIRMNDEIEFVGYDFALIKQSKFELVFYWKCLKKIDHRYSVLATMEREGDSIEPGHRFELPIYEWKPKETIKEIRQFRVPDNIAQREYKIKISLYDINEQKEIFPLTIIGKVEILDRY